MVSCACGAAAVLPMQAPAFRSLALFTRRGAAAARTLAATLPVRPPLPARRAAAAVQPHPGVRAGGPERTLAGPA